MDARHYSGDDERNLASGPPNITGAFWTGYRFAVRNRCVPEFLHLYRGMRSFDALVSRAEQMRCANCDDPILPEDELCEAHRREAAIRSGEAA